jgi:osmotically-inducible protein OsmY
MSGDIQLQKSVLDELAWEPTVEAAHIGVTAKDGVVTLTGHVGNYVEKVAAERAARRVKGVRAIVQEIEVKLPSSDKRSDEDIAASALSVLRWHAGLPADQIQLKLEDGNVTLSGEVSWQYQKDQAESDIRKIQGVRSIANRITVKPAVQPFEVKRKIEEALKRNAELEASDISISASGSSITLSGHVNTWHQREIAEQAAWSAPGVTAVTDQLQVGA